MNGLGRGVYPGGDRKPQDRASQIQGITKVLPRRQRPARVDGLCKDGSGNGLITARPSEQYKNISVLTEACMSCGPDAVQSQNLSIQRKRVELATVDWVGAPRINNETHFV